MAKRSNESTVINPKFEEHYLKYIRPKEALFEMRRRKALSKYKTRVTILLSCVFVVIIAIIDEYNSQGHSFFKMIDQNYRAIGGYAAILLPMSLALRYWIKEPEISFELKIKQEIFPEVFKFFGRKFKYIARARIDLEHLKSASEIIPEYDLEYVEDFVGGEVAGVKIELFDLRFVNADNGTRFSGSVIFLSMNKNFSGKIFVGNERHKNYEKIQLEDPRFAKRFKTYASDQVESRYVLTPSFMERIIALEDLFDGKIQCSFFDDTLMIKLTTDKEFFDISSIKEEINLIPDINLVLEEMKLIFQIIKILKLDKKTGL